MSIPGPSLRGAVDLSGLVRRANPPPPAPGSAPAPSAGGLVVEISEATFPQIVELSSRVPVVVELYAPGLAPALGPIVESYGGRLVLATVDAQANPGIAEAFQVREVPAAAGVIGGRPVPLFVGTPAEEQVRQVFDQLLQVAAQNGITGTLDPQAAPDADGAPAEPVEEPLPPLHQEAYDAISAGNYAAAVAAYKRAIAQNPRDALAVARADDLVERRDISTGQTRFPVDMIAPPETIETPTSLLEERDHCVEIIERFDAVSRVVGSPRIRPARIALFESRSQHDHIRAPLRPALRTPRDVRRKSDLMKIHVAISIKGCADPAPPPAPPLQRLAPPSGGSSQHPAS